MPVTQYGVFILNYVQSSHFLLVFSLLTSRKQIPDNTYVCVSGGKKCSFFGKFAMLCFLETPFLRFFLLLYYLRRKEILRGRWFSRIIFPGPVILLAISQNKDSSTGFFCENCKIFGPAIFRTSVGDCFS